MTTHVFSKKLQDMLMALSDFKTPEEYVEKMMEPVANRSASDREYYRRNYTAKATVKAQIEDLTQGPAVTLSTIGMEVVHFTLERYPACCGAQMIHHFRCNRELKAEQFNPIMDQLIAELKQAGYIRNIERIITMMVEERRLPGIPTIDMGLERVKAPNMQFKPLWDYWHTCPKVNTRLMFNVNSGNVLHDMEVILK